MPENSAQTAGAPVTKQLAYTKPVALGSGQYTFRFSLWTSETDGSQVWFEEQDLVLGMPVINTCLGKVTTLSGVDFSQQFWVQVEQQIDKNSYVILGPRDILTVSPYALWSAIGTDSTKVAKAGDTMTGPLTLPANGLMVGANQLAVSGGNVGIGTPSPKTPLEVNGSITAQSLNVSGNIGTRGYDAVKGLPEGWGGGVHTFDVYAEATIAAGTKGSVKAYMNSAGDIAGSSLTVTGVVRADTFVSTNAMRHRMYPENPIVYQDIFDAKAAGAIAKQGNPAGYDEKSYSVTLWNDRRIISFGNNNEADGNGAVVTIPAGFDTVWLRVLGERWNVIKAYFVDGGGEQLGLWTGGNRSANCYCPDGSLTDGYKDAHQWVPIPAGRSGKLALISKPSTSAFFWLSGLGFSRNPWAHAVQSALSYHWVVNGGNAPDWDADSWNSDSLARISLKTKLLLKVPVVPSKKDKLLYLIEHNSNWNGCMHNGITVNNKPIERFLATYDNPFARHWNSKYYERYVAARIPAGLIPDSARYLDVVIDMSKQNEGIHFREMGTHDLEVPWS